MKKLVEANNEAVFGILPVLKNERKYGFWDTLLITIGYGIATWCYAQGATMVEGLSFKQLLFSIFAPNIVVLAICCLLAVVATRYGVDYWVWLKTVFGHTGFKIVCVAVIVMQMPWFAINANMFAASADSLLLAAGVHSPPILAKIVCLVPIILGGLIAVGGVGAMKWSSRIMVGALVLVGIAVTALAFSSVPLREILTFTPENPSLRTYMLRTEACLGFAASWTTSIAVIPRICKTERGAYHGTFIALALIVPLFVLLGGILAIVVFLHTGVYESDITKLVLEIGGSKFALLPLVLVFFANIGTAGVGTYTYAIVAKSSFPRLKFQYAVLFVCLITAFMAVSEKVTEYFVTYLSYSAYFYLSIMGVLLIDVFWVRRQKFSLPGLYGIDKTQPYRYSGGFNLIGFGCLILGITAGLCVFDPMTGTVLSPIFDYTTASFLTFLAAGAAYFVLANLPPVRAYLRRDQQ
jgi:NCS1 family nucleobase:cation symporter-1